MNYYYDINLNFNDEVVWEFYEWESTDIITNMKKVPLLKVDTKVLEDAFIYQLQFIEEMTAKIKGKGISYNDQETLNVMILSDGKNSLALEINDEGLVISRSKLNLRDENNLNEIIFTVKKTEVEYQKIRKYEVKKGLRQESYEKKMILCELKTLLEKKEKKKLQYLYYEWFGSLEEDMDVCYKKMEKDLKQKWDETIHNIYELIKISYSNV